MLKIPFFFGFRPRPTLSPLTYLWYGAKTFAAVCLALLVILTTSPNLPAAVTGLVGDWSFDEGAGPTALDFSGNNSGTLVNGPTYVSGKFGYALSFDGNDDHVQIPHTDGLNLANELTISAWVYNQAAENGLLPNSEYHIVAAKGWAAASGGSWTLAWDKKTNKLFFFARKSSDGGYNYVAFDPGDMTNEWHLVTAVFANGKLSLYFDGELAAGPVSLGTTKIKTNTEDVHIGANPAAGSSLYTWDGHLDEVQIYNRALTDAEIQTLFYGDLTPQELFDFSVASSGDLSVTRGTTIFTNISATLVSGTSQVVSFAVSGIPPGARKSFSRSKCMLSCTTILTIKTSNSTPPGTYPITVTATAAGIQKNAYFNLSVALPTVAAPAITPNGGTYASSISVTLKSATSKASVYYTTDGTQPTKSSKLYKGTFSLQSSTLVRAKAFKSGFNDSSETSASFTVGQPFSFSLINSGDQVVTAASSVTNTVSANLVSGSTQAVTFSASGLPTGATASFSSNSCSPSCSSTLTISTSGSTPAGSSTITVTATGGSVTQTTTFNLSVNLPTVATPTITPNGGSYTGSVPATLQTATSGAFIYYTTDGTTPSQSSTPYTGAMALTSSATVKAKAFKTGYTPSGEASASFTVNQPFDFSLSNAGNKTVTAGSSVANTVSATLVSGSTQPVTFSASGLPAGATASFSSNSCSPTCSSTLTINTSGSTPAGSSTITVTATGGSVIRTTTFSLTVSWPTVATPTISPNGGTYTGSVSITLQSSTAGASIYYTTDGSTPTQSSALYTGTMTLTSSAIVKAKAFKSGYNPSSDASATFTIASAPKITVTWQDNSSAEDNFQIERKTGTAGTYSQIATVVANVTSYLDTSVTIGFTYCYRIRAANSSTTSNYSNEACATAQ